MKVILCVGVENFVRNYDHLVISHNFSLTANFNKLSHLYFNILIYYVKFDLIFDCSQFLHILTIKFISLERIILFEEVFCIALKLFFFTRL